MSVTVHWLDEPYILINEYTGNVTEDELDQVVEKNLYYLSQGEVCFMVDMTHMRQMPNNIMRIVQNQKILNHQNTGWMALVKPNIFIKMAAQVVRLRNFEVFDDRDVAIAFLREKVAEEQSQTEQS